MRIVFWLPGLSQYAGVLALAGTTALGEAQSHTGKTQGRRGNEQREGQIVPLRKSQITLGYTGRYKPSYRPISLVTAGLQRFSHFLSHFKLLNLSGYRHRIIFDKMNITRNFEVRNLAVAIGFNLFSIHLFVV